MKKIKIRLLSFFILVASLYVNESYSQEYAKIKGVNGIDSHRYIKWKKDLKVDYVFFDFSKMATKLLISFDPDISKGFDDIKSDLTPCLSSKKSWIEDIKTKNRYYMTEEDWPLNDDDDAYYAKPRFYLYPYAGKIRFALSFDMIPDDTKEFDVYLENKLCFKKIKLGEIKDYNHDSTPFTIYDYQTSKITFVNCLKGSMFNIEVDDKLLDVIMYRRVIKEEYNCYLNYSMTLLFPDKYD